MLSMHFNFLKMKVREAMQVSSMNIRDERQLKALIGLSFENLAQREEAFSKVYEARKVQAYEEGKTKGKRQRVGCLNRLLSVDRFLDSRCQNRLFSAWWGSIFKASASSQAGQPRPRALFVTV